MPSFELTPPSGTRDFLPEIVKLRDQVISTIKGVFERFGFVPLETPAFERIEVITGKYGEEGEKLIFKILKRGTQAATGETDFALRYDFTVPLARVVALYRNQLGSIFKRYQIGPVWRADHPAKGRFREFYQCDIDTVGNCSPIADVETVFAMTEVLQALQLPNFTIRFNSRKALKGLMEAYNITPEDERKVMIALDKLDKIPLEKAIQELIAQGLSKETIQQLEDDIQSSSPEEQVRQRLHSSEIGKQGLQEVDRFQHCLSPLLKTGKTVFSPFLARGLDYYTGIIFEFGIDGFSPSIAAGGRYDGLIGMFSKGNVPACGCSLGLDRLLSFLAEKQMRQTTNSPEAIVCVWDEHFYLSALQTACQLREKGIDTECYPGRGDLRQQLRYASQKGVSFCILLGPHEQAQGVVTLKDMRFGIQYTLIPDKVSDEIVRLRQ
ncbi:histidine--tRNA ligase [Pajaroellobacter abortibovis]|uniref:Histidine--tRNA ligase n=1 Tax=Pajaroellobacter abortibovis TaxID=1882918 RepID=A0A1L6MY72_9BACT|nr:histidine--tRNA ligase [Pajaroellobacter abortibovis]APS00358.1 histidine--tRNA ligase [Pajaroellobacter abortibovis]